MNNKTKYWIIIDSWNLLESFVTESISPFSFYKDRSFGNNLSRYFSKVGETFNHLILSEISPKADYAIEVSHEQLDENLLEKISKNEKAYLYPKTIYYKKGYVRFRFKSDDLRTGFIAESKILFEVKCVEKYQNDFFIDNSSTKSFGNIPHTKMAFDQSKYLDIDQRFNSLKGAIIAYARGQMTSLNEEQQDLQILVTDLKNSFTGLNTQLMMNDDPISDLSCMQKIILCKNEYNRQGLEQTNMFDILRQVFLEIVNLSSMRSKELSRQKTPEYKRKVDEYNSKRLECRSLMNKIEEEYSIKEIRIELESIKQREAEKGKAKGKTREFFGKTTFEYQRKQELNEIIGSFEKENKEFSQLKKELIEIENKISNHRYGSTEYDTTLSGLFIRISDGINDILKRFNLTNTTKSIDLSKISLNANFIEVTEANYNKADLEYFNIILNYLIDNSLTKNRQISEFDIQNIIKETGLVFSKKSYSNSTEGKTILDTLHQYWDYKKNKTSTFTIPEDLDILQSIMSFFVKAQGFDQIERFMLNRKYKHKEYAFMLWGACIGFAAIPKTFTSVIYNHESIDKELDVFFELLINNQKC